MSGRNCISISMYPSPWQASQRPPFTLNEKRPGLLPRRRASRPPADIPRPGVERPAGGPPPPAEPPQRPPHVDVLQVVLPRPLDDHCLPVPGAALLGHRYPALAAEVLPADRLLA